VHVEQNGQGARIRITENAGGHEVTRTYQGESLEAILRERPQLERELSGLHIQAEAGSNLDLRFDLGAGLLGGERWLSVFGQGRGGLPLAPEGRARPIISDRLGVIARPLDEARRTALELEGQGLLVERTYPETYAQLLGVGAGSVLLELNGEPLREIADIERAMRARQPDDPLRLAWLDELGQRQEKTWSP
jgi:hypothetical protein